MVKKIDFAIVGILLGVVLFYSACLARYQTFVVVENKNTYLSSVDWSFPRVFIIEFELDGKKYSTRVYPKFYKTIERGDVIQLEYRKIRFSKSMIVDFSNIHKLKKGEVK